MTVACLGYVVPYVHLVSSSTRIDGFLNVWSLSVICGVDTIKGNVLLRVGHDVNSLVNTGRDTNGVF